MNTRYFCDLCHHGIVRGIIHRIGDSFVCHDCRNKLVESYGEEVDETANAQQAAQPVNTCPNCHKPIDDTQIFCDDCAFLPIEAPEQTAQPVSGQGV